MIIAPSTIQVMGKLELFYYEVYLEYQVLIIGHYLYLHKPHAYYNTSAESKTTIYQAISGGNTILTLTQLDTLSQQQICRRIHIGQATNSNGSRTKGTYTHIVMIPITLEFWLSLFEVLGLAVIQRTREMSRDMFKSNLKICRRSVVLLLSELSNLDFASNFEYIQNEASAQDP
ncbi:hypothetical protein DFH29DRAFT_872032 [Suillus ampliporus]|nr:hypothetical protein DFH29DRAFT_872032 [Suillus ampliporus]